MKLKVIGLCMSPGTVTRTLPWSGTLVNKPVKELASWLRFWNSFEATVGIAAINAEINGRSQLPAQGESLSPYGPGNLAVFEYFLPMIRGKKVVIIAMSAGIFTNCRSGQIAKSLILSAIYSPCCLLPVACCLRTALYW